MSMRVLLAGLFLFTAIGTEAGEARKPLIELDKEATRQLEEKKAGRLASERFQEWKTAFKAKLDAEVARAHMNPEDMALQARIMTRIGEGKDAVAVLNQALEGDAGNPILLSEKGKVLYEQNDYAGAASSALQAWEASGKTDQDAWTLYMMSKGRRASSAAAPPQTQPSTSRSEAPSQRQSPLATSLPQKTASTTADPGLLGTPDPAWAQTSAARRILQKSKLGNEVLMYALGEGVKFELADMPSDSGAQFDKARKTILVPKDIASKNPVDAAVSIGHEAFHARQTLRDGMILSIETEQDANFADRVIYHELLRAGEPNLPKYNTVEWNYQRWRKQIALLALGKFQSDITVQYGQMKKARLNALVEKVPGVMRLPMRAAVLAVDSDFLKDYETLDYQKGKWWNVLERDAIESTRKKHIEEQAWQHQWMREHRAEF